MRLLPFVTGGPGGVSGGLTELGVIGGLVLAGVVKVADSAEPLAEMINAANVGAGGG